MTSLWIVIPSIALTAVSAVCAVYWFTAFLRIGTNLRELPTARRGLDLPPPDTGWERICVIVPAHNERGAIPTLVRSLRAQDHPDFRVVLALDRCDDDTAAVAREAIAGDSRFQILEIDHCPNEWAGKVHAVHKAVSESASAADSRLLLFIDADTELDPACLRAAAALLHARNLDLLSLLSTLTCDRWFERVAQTSAVLELLRQYPLTSANRRDRARPFANGQFMLFRRDAYERLGGHAAVRSELLEDIALARKVAWGGGATGLLIADGMIHCRMYESWPEFRRGWKRIFTEAANRRANRLLELAVRQCLFSVLLPVASVATIAMGGAMLATGEPVLGSGVLAAGLAGTLAWTLSIARACAAQRVGADAAIAYPLGSLLVAGILRAASRDLRQGRATQWGGRSYQRADRTDRGQGAHADRLHQPERPPAQTPVGSAATPPGAP